eukprot:6404661-Pyramimonas_sp.AAC.1
MQHNACSANECRAMRCDAIAMQCNAIVMQSKAATSQPDGHRGPAATAGTGGDELARAAGGGGRPTSRPGRQPGPAP